MLGVVWKEDGDDRGLRIGCIEILADKGFTPASQRAVFEFNAVGFGGKEGCEESVGFFTRSNIPGVTLSGLVDLDIWDAGCSAM